MRHRCRNPKNPFYKKYGGQGITVIDEWHDSFAAFLADVGKRPSPKHLLGRLDKGGNYTRENTAWIDRSEQNGLRRRNRRGKARPPITYNGETLPASVWAARAGITVGALYHRINDYGWTLDEALGGKPRKVKRGQPQQNFIEHNGMARHASEWAADAGLHLDTFMWRYRRGWPMQRIMTEKPYNRQ